MKRAVEFEWHGSRPPTPAEKRALRRAAKNMRPGRYKVQAVRAKRRNPSEGERAFQRFHWGNPPTRTRSVKLPRYNELYELGDLVRVDYLTEKGDEKAIYFHEFEGALPKLTATPGGKLGPIVGGSARVTERGIVG